MGWLLPVGTPGGICSGFTGIPDGSGIVRFGDDTMLLDSAGYRLWRAAAAAPERQELVEWANAERVSDAESVIGSLKEEGLLIEQRADIGSAIGRLALCLTGECLGNGTDRVPKFGVIGRNGTRIDADLYIFEVLLRSDGVSRLSVICDALDSARPGVNGRSCLDRLAEGLPLLVRNGVAHLVPSVTP
jgi:hypothetical protein